MLHLRTMLIGLAVSLFVRAAPGTAAGVLENVPRDAHAVIVVRHLSQVDARATKLFETLGVPLPGPLALLQSFAGVGTGLDTERDLLIAVLPPESDSQSFHVALWLPVADYDALVRSLEGDPERQIAAVTVAGEDLLVARRGDWAVVMDPDQRGRLEQTRLVAERASRSIMAWESWVAANDVTLLAPPAGIRAASTWLAKQKRSSEPTTLPAEGADDDPFGPPSDHASPGDSWAALLAWCRSRLAEAPELQRRIAEARGVGCALKLDEAGNAVVGLRMALPDEAVPPHATPPAELSAVSPPRLFDGGDFVLAGSGRVDPRWSVLAVAPYVQNVAEELTTGYGVALDDDDVSQFRRAVQQAVTEVYGFAVLTRPGRAPEGVFTNNFFAVRVASDAVFIEHAAEAVRRWNAMFDRAGGALPLKFEARPVAVADRPGTEYSIDMAGAEMAAALGVTAIPEFRQTLEKLFGPGGKFRFQMISVDDRTVLLAAATEEQAAAAVELLGRTASEPHAAAADAGLQVAQSLLSDPADWQLYFSPDGYVHWLQRQMDAVLGPVIGGPIVRDMPASPPIGAAGGLAKQTAWVEVAVPAATVKTCSKYVRE